MSVLIKHLAFVSESRHVKTKDLMKVSAALQKQASRDLAPIWEIAATVDAFERLEDVPSDYWRMIVMDDIGEDALGVHMDKDNQPYALIRSSDDIDVWSATASHEMLEMLVDPFGNRLKAGASPKPDQGRVNFLVEVCDPSEAPEYAYSCNGILVSDFYTPQYLDPTFAGGVRYSYTGALTEPRQVLPGGYLSWHEPVSDHWWQQTWFEGQDPQFVDLGRLTGSASLRSQVDRITKKETAKVLASGREKAAAAGLTASANSESSSAVATRLREQISVLTGKPGQGGLGSGRAPGIRRAPRPKLIGD